MALGFIHYLRSLRIGMRITLMVGINVVVALLFLAMVWWASWRVDQSLEHTERLSAQSSRVENISKKSLRLMLVARQFMSQRESYSTSSQLAVYGGDLERIILFEAEKADTLKAETERLLEEVQRFQSGVSDLANLKFAMAEDFRNLLEIGENVGSFLAIVSANARGEEYYSILPEMEKVSGWLSQMIARVNRFYFSGEDSDMATNQVETLAAYLPALARRSGSDLRARYLRQAGELMGEYRASLLSLIEGKAREKRLVESELDEPQNEIQRVINRMLSLIAAEEREAVKGFRDELKRVAIFSIGLVGVLLTLSLLLSWAIGRSITVPLRSLHKAVQDQAAGRPVRGIPEGGGDELSALAGTVRKVVDLQAEKDRLIGDLSEARDEVQQALQRIRTLLDNSGQGVVSFGPDLLVEPEYSRESLMIFGREEISGESVAGLLRPDGEDACSRITANLQRICKEEDEFRRSLRISLMPGELHIRGRVVEIQYRPLSDMRLMLILTDVSGERELADAVEAESRRLALVVGAVTNRDEMLDVMDDFESFLQEADAAAQAAEDSGEQPSGELAGRVFRLAHTYKGLFALMDCIHLPQSLQDAETRLAGLCALLAANGAQEPESRSVQKALAPELLRRAKDKDLEVIRQTLGDEFLDSRGEVVLPQERASILMEFADILPGRLQDASGQDIAEGLRILRELRHVELARLLERYPRMAVQMAERMEKELEPFEVQSPGEPLLVDPVRLSAFVRSLVHVFRNAVDHGIESREERLEAGKDERGHMGCELARLENGGVEIRIWDDGRGLDTEALMVRAKELGLPPEVLEQARDNPALLVFAQGLSTAACDSQAGQEGENGSDLVSGRGVGMAAVKAELDRLGGQVAIDNKQGDGVGFIFRIPGKSAS